MWLAGWKKIEERRMRLDLLFSGQSSGVMEGHGEVGGRPGLASGAKGVAEPVDRLNLQERKKISVNKGRRS